MKNVIAITACLKRCSVAISYQNQVFQVNEYADSSTNLPFILQNVIKTNDIEIKKIEGIITTSGPGSFTGIRTAQSLSKAIAMTLNIPSASVSYFEVIDHLAAEEKSRNRLIVIKSEKNQAYFKKIQNGSEEIGVSSYENLINKIKECNVLLGESIFEIHQLIKEKNASIIYREIENFRDAKHLLDFSEKIVTANAKISPLYINAAAKFSS